MKEFSLLAVLALLVVSEVRALLVDSLRGQELVDYVNNLDTTWTALLYPRFAQMTDADFQSMTGFSLDQPVEKSLPTKQRQVSNNELPESFDSRENWPKCKEIIGHIRDQSRCQSCWAITATSVISDRICIFEGKNVWISAIELLSCCKECGNGCEGSHTFFKSFDYYANQGLVTGGDYNNTESCQPYPFPPCAHEIPGSHFPACPENNYDTPTCSQKCNGELSYEKEKHYGNESYALPNDEQAIRQEIFDHGPVLAGLYLPKSFHAYRSGVYQKLPSENIVGGHVVRLIGWGVENNVPYWLGANSYNQDWGENGFFKIRRGNNECGIEDMVAAGLPRQS